MTKKIVCIIVLVVSLVGVAAAEFSDYDLYQLNPSSKSGFGSTFGTLMLKETSTDAVTVLQVINEDGTPVENEVVVAYLNNIYVSKASTDAKGVASFKLAKEGTYQFELSDTNFISNPITITNKGTNIVLNLGEKKVSDTPYAAIMPTHIFDTDQNRDMYNGNMYCYVSISGLVAIPPLYREAGRFSEGLAVARTGSKLGYIDKNGKWIIKQKFDEAGNFSEGLAVVKIDDRYGYINKSGDMVIKPQYYGAYRFSDGVALVETGRNRDEHVYINKAGVIVLGKLPYDDSYNFCEGMALVCTDKKFGYINKSGKEVIAVQYVDAGNFSSGLAKVRIYGEYGYIDKTGKIAIKAQYEDARDFSEGLAAVKVGEKYGYINPVGDVVIKPLYYQAEQFSSGLAKVVVSRDEWGYIDKTGKYVIKFEHNFQQYKAGLFG
jgi:hypothetical protein